MFGFQRHKVTSFTATEIAERHQAGEVVLVDVREPSEFAAGHIEGAVLVPLSSFDPAALPQGQLVLYCAVGRRSAVAAESCRKAGVPVLGHLGGGLQEWVGAGLKLARE